MFPLTKPLYEKVLITFPMRFDYGIPSCALLWLSEEQVRFSTGEVGAGDFLERRIFRVYRGLGFEAC